VSDEKTSEADDVKKPAATESRDAPGDDAADDDDGKSADSMNPEAIARRVAALGEEDAFEKLARDEERKLAERRAAGKKKKKGGLEVAASKKLAKIGTRAEPKRTVAVAADADALIEKTAKLSEWAKENQKTVQLVGSVLALVLVGIAGFLYYENSRETDASVLLTTAVADERARIGEPPKDEGDKPAQDPGLLFKTFDLRRESALGKYREVQQRFPKTGAAILARLAEGSLLLDKHEVDPAMAAFQDVKSSPLAAADKEVKGRALEGVGFAHEMKAQLDAPSAPKHLDAALQAYKELEALDVRGFKELAMYHQARVLEDKGEKDKAKELLVALKDRFAKPEENPSNIPLGPAFPYLRNVAMDRLRAIDPSAAPPKPSMGGMGMPGGGRGAPQLSPEQIRKMIEAQQKKGAH